MARRHDLDVFDTTCIVYRTECSDVDFYPSSILLFGDLPMTCDDIPWVGFEILRSDRKESRTHTVWKGPKKFRARRSSSTVEGATAFQSSTVVFCVKYLKVGVKLAYFTSHKATYRCEPAFEPTWAQNVHISNNRYGYTTFS